MKDQDFSMCPRFETAFSVLGKRWNGLIIYSLMNGPKRFKDISHIIPSMSDKMLSERMKDLENEGILERHVYPETLGSDRIRTDRKRKSAAAGDGPGSTLGRTMGRTGLSCLISTVTINLL